MNKEVTINPNRAGTLNVFYTFQIGIDKKDDVKGIIHLVFIVVFGPVVDGILNFSNVNRM